MMISLAIWRRVIPTRHAACTLCTRADNFIINKAEDTVTILNQTYTTDNYTNITPAILEKLNKNLHCQKYHPLNLIRQRIQNYFQKNFLNRRKNPVYAVFDSLSPVVTIQQNYDSLLVPKDHPSRKKTDSFYINSEHMLRAHTSSHQVDIIKSGLDAFLVFGDVYRRDTIDSSHYPVFHQVEGVRLYTQHEVFGDLSNKELFHDGKRIPTKQEYHTPEAAQLLDQDLKVTLENLTLHLFGKDIEMKWVEAFFPFTHPSWELEIKFQGEWLEVLGCGVIEQEIMYNAGVGNKIGWAFGLGLERLAMKLYNIPDIRLFWSQDSGFLNQFRISDPETPIIYKPIGMHPPCINDISFWVPSSYSDNDFFDVVRTEGGDIVESVSLIDDYFHPKTQTRSHCYRIVYRHTSRPLSQDEVNVLHKKIELSVVQELGVELR